MSFGESPLCSAVLRNPRGFNFRAHAFRIVSTALSLALSSDSSQIHVLLKEKDSFSKEKHE